MKVIILVLAVLTFSVSGNLADAYAQVQSGVNNSAVNLTAYNSDSQNLSDELQQNKITGTVTDENGGPLPGVTVLVKGTNIGSVTDATGKYTLPNAPQNATLVFSFVGMTTQEIATNSRVLINVVLKEEAIGLDEVVVVGYGTQSKRNVTSSIGSVKSDAIANYAVRQVGQALQGKVAGIQIIQNSGSPGSALTVRIRGTGTVNNSNPLYVIDGNLGADPDVLDPSNIESIEVLKSASAAAIYGAQGANGVVMITTKKGSIGAPGIQVGVYTGMQKVQRMMPVCNGKEYATVYNLARTNAGLSPLFTNVESLGVGTDWQEEIFRTAPVTSVDMSVSGGSEQGKYYVSGSYFTQQGIVLANDYSRLNFRVNSEHKLFPGITLGENLLVSYGVTNTIAEFGSTSPVANAWNMDPNTPVKFPNGNWGYPNFADTKNPVAELEFSNNTYKRPVINGSVFLDIKPWKTITYRSQINLNYGFSNYHYFLPTFDIFPLQRNLQTAITRTVSQTVSYDWQNTVTYKTTVAAHDIEVLGGVTIQEAKSETVTASALGAPENANDDENLRYLNLAKQGQTVAGNAGEFGLFSVLGRVNYSYKGTYLLTGNIRADGSSRFGENNRFGVFPSFSAGWRISDESFLQDVSFINDLKLRAGWGMLGNQNSLSNYAFANSLTSNLNYIFGNSLVQGQALTSQGNPDLRWEATKETELGLDFIGFKEKITFSVGYYNKNTTDMLLRVPIPSFTGIATPPFVNGGDVTNKGIEISLGYKKTTPGDFYYDVSVNLTHNKNEVTKLSNNLAAITSGFSRTQVGSSIGEFYGYVMDGLFQTTEDVANHAFQTAGTAPGDIRYKDLNDDDIINQFDRQHIGNPWPGIMYGLTADFRWKQFDMNLAISGTYGNEIYAAWKLKLHGSNFFNYDKKMLDAWSGPGTSNTIPQVNVNDRNNNMRESSYFIEDGSYMRLKHMQIGFNLPKGTINSIKKLRIYVSFENLLTLTSYQAYDPEISSGSSLSIGQDWGFYPQPRTITAGMNIGF